MEHQQGDLVWAKLEGHPWWPALVCPGPQGTISKSMMKNTHIHVQFFSEPPTTGWVKEKSVSKFEGKYSLSCQPGGKYHSTRKTFVSALDSAHKALLMTIKESLSLVVSQEKSKKGSVKRKKAKEAVGGSAKKQKTLPKPSTAPASKPSTAPASKPSTASASKPSTTSACKPSTASASKPSTAPASKPSTASASKPSTASACKPSTASASKPSTASASKPSTATVSKPITASACKPITASACKPITATVSKPSTASACKPITFPFRKPGPLSFVSRGTTGTLRIKSSYNIKVDRVPQRWRNSYVLMNLNDIPEGLQPHQVFCANSASGQSESPEVTIEMPDDLVEEEEVNDFDSEDEYVDSDNDPAWNPEKELADSKGVTFDQEDEEDNVLLADDSDEDPGWVPGKKEGFSYTKRKKGSPVLQNTTSGPKSKQNVTKDKMTIVVDDTSTGPQPKIGDFLIEKAECKDGNIPFLWRFKRDGLVQKYEKKEEGGKVFYQNTYNYSDWWSCYADKYEKVAASVFYKMRNVEKVLLTGSVTTGNKENIKSASSSGSDDKQQDQEISSTTPELCPLASDNIQRDFEIGSFVLDMKDRRNVDNFHIWKIESSMLIKKYEPCCHQGKLLHKPVKIYRGYKDIGQHYLPLKTRPVASPADEEMVEVSEDTRPKLDVSLSLESAYENNPLLRHFYVYMQVFLSQALEPGFLDEVTKTNDETYMEPMHEINKLVKQKITNIERKVRWTDKLKFALMKCPCLRNVPKPDVTKKCEGLVKSDEKVSEMIFLFGADYDLDTLKTTSKQHACQEFRVGKTAVRHIHMYHQLCHFKLNLYEKCTAKIKLIQDQEGEKDIEKIMDLCLGNKAWVLQNFEDFTTLVEIN